MIPTPTSAGGGGRRDHPVPPDEGRREALVAALRARTPLDDRERASLSETLEWLTTLERPFDEDAHRVHVTSSAVVVGPRGTLLHRHKRLGLWMQPGGHLEPGETIPDAAVREVAEETGLHTAHPPDGPLLLHVDVHEGGRGHRHLDVRHLLLAGDEGPAPPAGESQHVAWFAFADALALADAGLVAALRAAEVVCW